MDEKKRLAVAEIAKSAGNGKKALAEVFVQTIRPNHLALSVLSAMMPTRQLNPGDRLVYRTTKGIPVRSFVPGTDHLASQFTRKEVGTHMFDEIIAKVRHNLYEVQSGEIGTIADMQNEMRATLVDNVVAKTLTLLTSVWGAGDDLYLDATSSFDSTALDALIEEVMYRAGNVNAIVGTRRALQPLYEMAGFTEFAGTTTSDTTLFTNKYFDEWTSTGRITSYKGSRVLELPQVFKRTFDAYDTGLLPEDYIFVIGDTPGEVVLFDAPTTQEHIDTSVEPADLVISIWQKYGMVITDPYQIGLIQV